MFQDISESTAKQYIDAAQLWDVLQDAERRSAKYTGSMYWRKTGAAKTEYLIKELKGIEKSLGCRSSDTEHIIAEFKRNKAESTERVKALRDAMKKQQRVNFALRIGRTPNTVIAVLNAIADAGISDHFLVIGTNALYAYETHAGVYLSGDITATKDFDFLWDSRKHLSLVSKDLEFNTKGLIGAEELAMMRPDAILVNTSRSALIDTQALEDALTAGRPGQAAIDVFDIEPPSRESTLRTKANLLTTPHLGFVAEPVFELFSKGITATLEAWLNQKPIPYPFES